VRASKCVGRFAILSCQQGGLGEFYQLKRGQRSFTIGGRQFGKSCAPSLIAESFFATRQRLSVERWALRVERRIFQSDRTAHREANLFLVNDCQDPGMVYILIPSMTTDSKGSRKLRRRAR